MRRPGIFAPSGRPSDLNMMLHWRPGAVTCYYNQLQANDLFNYKARNPAASIIVRFQHPPDWRRDPEQAALSFGRQVAGKWAELRPLEPYVCFAGELNTGAANGDTNTSNQAFYETQQFYQTMGGWVGRTAQVIKDLAPEMKLITPPFAAGRHEDGSPNDQGEISEPFAGYDYLAEAVRTYFDNTLAVHAYWGDINGSHPDHLYDPARSSWYAFRWRRLLKLFQTRYNIQAKIIIAEASNFATYDLDLFEQITYFSRECLTDPRVLALTFYVWEDPDPSLGNIFTVWTQYILDLPGFTQRLAAQPDVIIDPSLAPWAALREPSIPVDSAFGGPIMRVRFEDGHIEAMPLETYLRGVVPAEMPASWPAEALKAQAVAARTYALRTRERARRQNQVADITSTFTRHQQFDPRQIHPAADEAILATRGLVVNYQGAMIEALFSANCGGHTFNNEDVEGFSRTPIPYLRRVACPNSGPKNGHGLGLCQYGARDFANQGRTFAQILAHYYQDTSLGPMPENI